MAEQQKGGGLAAKMVKVMGDVHRVPKNGTNAHFNYKFATEADIAEMIRGLLADNGVAFIPSVVPGSIERFEIKGGNIVTRLWLSVKFVDGESGEILESTWPGEGQDNADKGCYKAITGAEKYALMKTFLIPTGDDPENDNEVEKGARNRSSQTANERSAPPPAPLPGPAPVNQPAPKTEPANGTPALPPLAPKVVTKPQLDRLFAIAGSKGWATEDAKGIITAAGFASSKEITADKYDAICKTLEDGPPVKEPAHVGS